MSRHRVRPSARRWESSLFGRTQVAGKSIGRGQNIRLAFEQLDVRRVLTSRLYIDFGDNLPAGGLAITVAQLHNDFGAGTPGIQGPSLVGLGSPGMNDGTNLLFNPLSSLVTFDFNHDGATNATDFTELRANVLALVQRYYAPFDVTVLIAPALNNTTSDTYLDGVRSTLQMGISTTGEFDAWTFVSKITRTDTGASIGVDISDFGLAPGVDSSAGMNTRDDSASVFADNILTSNSATAATALARDVAHESGHTFGLNHLEDMPTGDSNDLLSQDSVMRVGGNQTVALQNYNLFARFPMVPDTPPPTTLNDFDLLSNPNLLGPAAGFPAYVTGTGANDQIKLTSIGLNSAMVSVMPFANADFTGQIDVPGQAPGTPFQYPIDTTNGIIVDGGFGTDRIEIDANIGKPIAVRGMGNFADQIVVDGAGLDGSYLPGATTSVGLDGQTYFSGQINAGPTVIDFAEFANNGGNSSVLVSNFNNFTFTTPAGADAVNIGLNAVLGNEHQISGTSGGVAFVNLLQSGVVHFSVHADTNDSAGSQDDSIVVTSNGAVADTLQSLTIDTGNGDDTLTVNSTTGLALVPGGVVFDGGTEGIIGDTAVFDDSARSIAVDYQVSDTGISLCATPTNIPILVFSNTEMVKLVGTTGINQIDLTPSATAKFMIDGQGPSTTPGDYLSIRFAGTTDPKFTFTDKSTGTGMWTFANRKEIDFTHIEKLNFFPTIVLGADAAKNGKPTIKVVDAITGALVISFLAYESNYTGGVRVAVDDINGDGIPEIITAPGRQHIATVKIFDIQTGAELAGTAFSAYPNSFVDGVNLAIGDVDHDGFNDIVTAPSHGKAEIHTYLNQSATTPATPFDNTHRNRFLAFDKSFIGGASVAVGDVSNGPEAEILVGSGAGMRAEVRKFNGNTNGSVSTQAAFSQHFKPFDASQRGGVTVAVANLDADASLEIVVGSGTGGHGQIATFDTSNLNVPLHTFLGVYVGNGSNAPVRVAAIDSDFDGVSNIFAAQGPDGRSQEIRQTPPLGPIVDFLMDNDVEFRNGFYLASDINGIPPFLC